jgi:hypothetical protein
MEDKEMKHKYPILFITIMILFINTGIAHAAGQSSANYIIESDVISGGGGESSSANYGTEHTTGQPSAIGESGSANYYDYKGFWNVLYAGLPPVTYSVSGIGMNTPASPKWRASMAVNVDGSVPSGTVRYYYTRQRVSFQATSITSVTETTPGTFLIAGAGNGTKITGQTTSYCTGCSFTATILDSSPDKMNIEIDSGNFFSAPGGLRDLNTGNFSVTSQ